MMMTKLLAIDTSTNVASYAVTDGVKTFTHSRSDVREHATYILQDIDELLTKINLKIHELDGIVLGLGPGSFTGLRVACMVAKGLAYPHKLPILGVGSLTALLDHNGLYPALAMLDARMQQVYWLYAANSDSAQDFPKVDNIHNINLTKSEKLHIIHYNCEAYLSELPYSENQHNTQILATVPTANMLLESVKLGHYKLFDSISAEPLYVRNDIVQQN